MAARSRPLERLALRPLALADAAADRLLGWRGNPLYQSGAIVVALLAIVLVTGLWLILFYRVGAPWDSVARIAADPWVGRWVRGVHRYASDAAVVFTVVHLVRMWAQGRSWGPRFLAWFTGVLMTGALLLCGWTGYVMAWDAFGQLVAQEGARMLDSLPFLSEPLGRAFTGEQPLTGAFFFINLFAHIAIPLGLGLLLWLHVSRVARPVLLPPRKLLWSLTGLLVLLAVAVPAPLAPEASPFRLPAEVPLDLFFAFWIPLVRPLSGGAALALFGVGGLALVLLPALAKRRGEAAPAKSVVDEDLCTGCRQCALDCPYDAITMLQRAPGGRSAEVARVDPDLCVSCGICAASCAPMGVGPAGRTGRDQLARLRAFLPEARVHEGRTVVVACDRGLQGWRRQVEAEGAVVHPVDCAGNLHTSVIELLVRNGAAGVLVLACPPRDCWNREGPRWLSERVYQGREAELQERVDRRRVRIAHAGAGEGREAVAALRAFMRDTASLDAPAAEAGATVDTECDPVTALLEQSR